MFSPRDDIRTAGPLLLAGIDSPHSGFNPAGPRPAVALPRTPCFLSR